MRPIPWTILEYSWRRSLKYYYRTEQFLGLGCKETGASIPNQLPCHDEIYLYQFYISWVCWFSSHLCMHNWSEYVQHMLGCAIVWLTWCNKNENTQWAAGNSRGDSSRRTLQDPWSSSSWAKLGIAYKVRGHKTKWRCSHFIKHARSMEGNNNIFPCLPWTFLMHNVQVFKIYHEHVVQLNNWNQ